MGFKGLTLFANKHCTTYKMKPSSKQHEVIPISSLELNNIVVPFNQCYQGRQCSKIQEPSA